MASFEIILGAALRASSGIHPYLEGESPERFDFVIDGERFSAASEPEQAACLLRDLIGAGTAVLEGRAAKALVSLPEDAWELCLVREGDALAASVYRTGAVPEVRLLDRPVAPAELVQQVRAARAAMAAGLTPAFAAELTALMARLEAAAASPCPPPARAPEATLRWQSPEEGRPVRVGFEAVVAPGAGAGAEGGAVRADLHALLFRGRVVLDVRGQRGELSAGFVFLQLERLLSLCRPLLEAYGARRALHLRVAAGASTLALRLGSDGRLSLTASRPGAAAFTAPALDPREFVLPVVEAALALAQLVVRCDRARARNLRLRTLRSEARALHRMLRNLSRTEAKLNDDPAPYRASAVTASATASTAPAAAVDLGASTRLRYTKRWHVEIEGIDLSGTILCGDRLVIPGARELYSVDRRSGAAVWSKPLPRAATTLAGGDILRLSSRGEVELRAADDGEVLWSSRVAPRVGAQAHAFAVAAPGLPRLVVLAEAERRLVALDLRTGEARWRYAAREGGAFRTRRLGRLLIVTSGDPSITALDVNTGEIVWRFVATAPFVLTPAVHGDTVVAVAGVPSRGSARLVAIDAFTGRMRWSRDLGAAAASVPVGARDAAAIALADRDGVHLAGFDLATGAPRFRETLLDPGAGAQPVTLAGFDELLVANLTTGRACAVDARDGRPRWSRTLGAPVGNDLPRRLDVQLRGGVLFVPQASLAVLRPADGALMANLDACDLVPDLVRVDEECALYVAEESGHVGCYEPGARLSVVRPLHLN